MMAASRLPGDPELPGRPVLGFVACVALVRRDAFLAVGGFDERYGVGGEEGPLAIELAARGWALIYLDEITAQHWPSRQRDPAGRRRILVRNASWLLWSRRRWPTVLRSTARSLGAATSDAAVRAGVLDAIGASREYSAGAVALSGGSNSNCSSSIDGPGGCAGRCAQNWWRSTAQP